MAKWRKQANYSMQHSSEREIHIAAAAERVCADALEAALRQAGGGWTCICATDPKNCIVHAGDPAGAYMQPAEAAREPSGEVRRLALEEAAGIAHHHYMVAANDPARFTEQFIAEDIRDEIRALSAAAGPETPLEKCKNPECPIGCPPSHTLPFGDE